MGKKRKHSDKDHSERLLRRIEKLEERLRKRRRRSHSYSSQSSYSRSRSESLDPVRYYDHEDYENYDLESNTNEPNVQKESTQSENLITHTLPASDVIIHQPPTSATPAEDGDVDKNEVIHLDEDILTILGDAPKDDSPVGKDTHIDIATRLQDVLQNGLKKDHKEKIIEEYPIPGNCQLFKAPILNAEIKAAVSEMLEKKDSSLAARQNQIGVALTALASAMDILVSDKSETSQTLLKHISIASRLLCDSHYIDTKMRRNFLISTLNNKLKDTLKESKRDKYLFGEGLPEKLKATKAITKSSQDLKAYKPKSIVTKNNATSSSTNNLNWKHPQSNLQSVHRKSTASSRHHRSAGPSTSYRGEPARKTTSSSANKKNAHYRQHKRS